MSNHRHSVRSPESHPFKYVAVDVLDEEELPTRVAGKVRFGEDGLPEWLGEVEVLDRQCPDDWAEENTGYLSSWMLQNGRLLMKPLEQSRKRDVSGSFLRMLFTPPTAGAGGFRYGGFDMTDNLAVLRDAYDKAKWLWSPDFDERVKRLRERWKR